MGLKKHRLLFVDDEPNVLDGFELNLDSINFDSNNTNHHSDDPDSILLNSNDDRHICLINGYSVSFVSLGTSLSNKNIMMIKKLL